MPSPPEQLKHGMALSGAWKGGLACSGLPKARKRRDIGN